jgi:hypothetical protein
MDVGREIQQHTSAIQAASSRAAYEMHQARLNLVIEHADYAEVAIRMRDDPSSASPADSLRWNYDLNLRINLYEMVHNNGETGTMAAEMAESWLAGLPDWTCLPEARSYWASARNTYTASFIERVEAAIAARPDCDALPD